MYFCQHLVATSWSSKTVKCKWAMSISVATFRVNLRWRGELNASMYKWSQLQNYLSLRLPITSRHHDKWPPVTMVSTRKKVHLGEILVSIRSMSEHCKQVVIPSPHYASTAALLPGLSDVWIFILLQNVFSTRAEQIERWWQHLSLTWARNLKLETLFANARPEPKSWRAN